MALLHKIDDPLTTGEELARRPDLNPCELVEGRVVAMSPTGVRHGRVELLLGMALERWASEVRRGLVVVGEVGIYLRRNPDTVRAADILYISTERLARRGPATYLDVPPELVVEVLSPDDRWTDVMEKIAEYLAFGVERVWIADPRMRKVFAYRTLTDVTTVGAGEVLRDEELLPGFQLAIDELFQRS
jgi:Uma2 family endonuclease